MESIYGVTSERLGELFREWNVAPIHAQKVVRRVWHDEPNSFADVKELPLIAKGRLAEQFDFSLPAVVKQTASDEGRSWKLLIRLSDGAVVETVVMIYAGRATVCVSSQAGCPLGCVFCATGQAGFTRNLSTSEISGQLILARRSLRAAPHADIPREVRNVVIMGMGEPLLNFEAVLSALNLFADRSAGSLAAKRLTISTVGIVPGIERLAREGHPYSLAVSLHTVDQRQREELLPIARTWSLEELQRACEFYARTLDKTIFFEWTLLAGENDSIAHAAALARWLEGIPAHVNLIPLNATASYEGIASEPSTIERFQFTLRERGVPSTVRRRFGIEINGGCGQLAAAETRLT